MITDEHGGWTGKVVRHDDGREGRIVSDYVGFLHRVLRIDVLGRESSHVQLNADGPDTGEAGWSWLYRTDGQDDTWYRLTDHEPSQETRLSYP